jgi:hypothetical protein
MANISLLITEGARALQTSAGPSRARRRGGASDRPTVLVLWTGYPPGPRTCRSLKRAGFSVIGAFPEGRHGGSSSGCVRPLRYPSPTADPDGFIARVAEICRTHSVDAIVPLDEDIVRLVAERAPEIGDVVIVGPTAHQYHTLCDKLGLTRTAQELGLDTPHTVVVDESGPDGPWPTLPSIVKPRTSRSETVRPRLVMTEAERDEYVGELVETGIGAIVQERIDGPRWLVQSVRGPGVFEHVAFRVLDEWPRGAGPASYKRNVEAPPTLVAAAQALLDHVDYNGPSGISFMEGGGRFYPHDANLRLGASSPASPHAGFDFPRRAVEAVLELDGTPFAGDWQPGRFMRLDLELEALGSAWATRKVGGAPGPILRRILSVGLSRQGMLDPSPYDPFWVGQLLARVGRKAGRKARSTLRPH